MLNYILPPIIIIVCVSALIMFLFRKADQLPAHEFLLDENGEDESKKKIKIMSVVGEIVLKFLERMMHRSKLWSLKFHNISNAWFQTIREKRRQSELAKKESLENNVQIESVDVKKNQRQSEQKGKTVFPEKEVRPMVSSGITMPQQKRLKEKNKLEDALIKRIAINPRDIEAYERLGDYYLESENFQDSLECFKQVLTLSPTHQKAKLRIKRLERMK